MSHFSGYIKLKSITCIPKEENLSKISLLIVVYTFASCCVAEQLKKVLDKLINRDVSTSWEFYSSLLDLFHFGNSIKNWIQTFYGWIKSRSIQNGVTSDCFYHQMGGRHGDLISLFIFCLCAEVLEIIIRNNKNIKGILIEVEEYNFSQYADDTTLFSNGSR